MTEALPLRILIADDHILFRSGVKAELSAYPHLRVVGEAGDGLEAVRLARETRPDVILMDIHMPRSTGMEAVETVKRELPEVRVIMLTVSDDDESLFEAIKRGADGYLLKNLEPTELLEMLARAGQGEPAINGKLAVRILKEFRQPDKREPPAANPSPKVALTAREIEVLERVVQGDSNADIARVLVISENTVKMHLANILDKLQLQNRIQAAVYAVREGLVDDQL